MLLYNSMTTKHYPLSSSTNFHLVPTSGVPIAQQIRIHFVRLITSGNLPSDSLLPSVRDLSNQLKVNVNTVRLAYQRLAEDGLVTTSQGVGTRVLPLEPGRLIQLARSESTNTVGVILPDVGNPFYSNFLRGVEEGARQHQTMMIVCSAHDDPIEQMRAFAQFSSQHVDGVIAVSCNLSDLLPDQKESAKSLPVVTADWPDSNGYSVQMDLENAGYEATRHLIRHGHQRIGLVTLARDSANIQPLNTGYARALRSAHINPDPKLTSRVNGFGMDEGRAEVRSLLNHPNRPTALFIVADMLALGAMQAIKDIGLRIPQDIALASFNNIAFAPLVSPPLTTADAPAYELGLESIKMLETLMLGKLPSRKHITLSTSLVIRESCGAHPTKVERGGARRPA